MKKGITKKIGLSIGLVLLLTGCGDGPIQPKNPQTSEYTPYGTQTSDTQQYIPDIRQQLQNDFLDAVASKDNRYIFVLKKAQNGDSVLQLWDNRNKKLLYDLAHIRVGKHIESIQPMSNNRVMFLEVIDGQSAESGKVVILDYIDKRLVSQQTLTQLPANYYINTNVDNSNENIVHVGDVAIDFSNTSRPVVSQQPSQLQISNSNGQNRDSDIRNYFGDDLVMAVPTLQKQGLFVVKREPHQTQALELYGMMGGIEYEYTIWQVTDGERFARIIPQSNGKVIFIITADSAPAGYAKIITYNYANKYKIKEKSVYDLYDPATYIVEEYENTSSTGNSYGASSGYQDSDYSTGAAWANSDGGNSYTYEDTSSSESPSYQDSDYSTGSSWANSDNYTYTDSSYQESDYSTGSVSANTDWAVLKKGKWYGTGHQTWKVVEDYRIELTIDDNEYYFTYTGEDYQCYGSLVLEETTADSFKFREYVYDGHCIDNYIVLTKVTDSYYNYESYLLDGTHTVSGKIFYNSDHTNSRN